MTAPQQPGGPLQPGTHAPGTPGLGTHVPGTRLPGSELPGDVPAPVRMYEMLYSSLVSQLLVAVAELGIADAIGDEVRHIDEIAERTETDPGALYRGLRALASVGVFTEVEPRTFGLTPLAATLRSDVPGSMRDLARYVGMPERQRSFGSLAHSLRTGKPSFDEVHGTDWWTYFAAHPELAAVFNSAMSSMSVMVNSGVLDVYDLSDVRRLVDVGAGRGRLVGALLQRYPLMTAVAYDLPRVVPEAEAVLAELGVSDRAECVGGDFLTSVPEGGDTYVVSWTIHDWDDGDAVAMLRNIRRAMGHSGQLIVIDEVIPEGDTPHFGKFEDIVMLSLLTGHLRTESEFVDLFDKAGFRLKEIRPTRSSTSVIVAVPA
ncbi:methyltransferase [Streptomyces lateritius]|uniref:methyltransferase n=1 Tax=Streptomyces lateritius TaxID=67313 RepID=UPI0016741570|nr:methyltransferase [Streptomyces lateritius]GGT81123.1 methyltransferase [Streptomyces lateritius]